MFDEIEMVCPSFISDVGTREKEKEKSTVMLMIVV